MGKRLSITVTQTLVENFMESFELRAIGNLARDPEVFPGSTQPRTRFCLVGNRYGGRDDEGNVHEDAVFAWFTAFGRLGQTIAKHARRGDQLFVEARLENSNWVDKHGDPHFSNDFVVSGFQFGKPGRLTRQALAEADAQQDLLANVPPPGTQTDEMSVVARSRARTNHSSTASRLPHSKALP
jgi:single-stranded DNA-binding protein